MLVLPVLDLLGGIVVRGIAGRRSEYRPLQSKLTTSVQPVDVARALRKAFGLTRLYVADLDAILHQQPNWASYRELIDDGFQLWIDAGVRDLDQSSAIRRLGVETVVGLESCPSPQALAEMVSANEGRVTFSVDLLEGRALTAVDSEGWSSDPGEILWQSVACGCPSVIVLDLADVGTSTGGRTEPLCRSALAEFPELKLTCGGGVRNLEDLQRLELMGATNALVASALHDGRLKAADLAYFSG